jgi:hypothetical protein
MHLPFPPDPIPYPMEERFEEIQAASPDDKFIMQSED